MTDTTLATIRTQIEKVTALAVVVNSPESKAAAQTNLSDVRQAGKALDAAARALKRPHQDALDAIQKDYKALKTRLDERDSALERALLTYKRQCDEAARIEQQKLLDRFEKQVAKKEAKAIADGKPLPFVPPPPVVAPTAKTEAVGERVQTVVKRKAWRIPGWASEAASLTAQAGAERGIPLEYFILDTARIGKVVRAGGTIPGIEVFEEESIAVRG